MHLPMFYDSKEKMLPLKFCYFSTVQKSTLQLKETISGNTCIKVCRSRNNKDQPTDSGQYTGENNPGITNLLTFTPTEFFALVCSPKDRRGDE